MMVGEGDMVSGEGVVKKVEGFGGRVGVGYGEGSWRARGRRLGRWMHGFGGRVVLLEALLTVAWFRYEARIVRLIGTAGEG